MIVLLIAFCPAAGEAASGDPPRPNIVLIMTDDQGCGDLSIAGNTVLTTPAIDRLARQGASFDRFYVSPVCAPTRACLMTGRYNYRTRAIDTWVGRAMMEPEEVTIAELFRDAGYRTGIFGKWHLGDCYPIRPNDQGFQEALVHRGGGLAQPSEPLENERRYTDPVLFHNGKKVHTRGYCTDVYFEAALKFLRQAHAGKKPFFAYIPTNAPHAPFHDIPQASYEKYRNRDLSSVLGTRTQSADRVARIFAMIDNIDHNVGRLLAGLDELGIAKNTMVVYLHDNGPNTARYVGAMRGMKSQVYEGGIRSPLFVRWPARLRAGGVSHHIAAHIDILPTLLDAAGVEPPAALRLDGRSLLPLLTGRETAWPDRTIYIQSHRGDAPVRYHNFAACGQRWKLLRATGFGRETPPSSTPFELYDLLADPREERNVAAQHPDIVKRMKAGYDAWFEDVSSTRPDNYAPPRIIAGTDHETTTVLTHQDWRRLAGPGWGSQGQWLLTFKGNHAYDVRVVTKNEIKGAHVELRIGDIRRELTFAESTRSFTFPAVRVPAGDANLQVTISAGKRTHPPYHVFVVQR